MKKETLLLFENRSKWHLWLAKNHKSATEAWVVHYKKASGKPSVSYDEALDEALCFGWIDGKKKAIDHERYAYRFTPRSPKSKWSSLNVERANRLIESGKMHKSGLEAFEGHEERGSAALPSRLPVKLQELFQAEKIAWNNFTGFSPGYKKLCIGWIASAKQEETQLRRLDALIQNSAANRKIKFM